MQPHPLTDFEIQKYYQNQLNFNGVYLRNNLPKIKNGINIIKLDEYKSIGTHWTAYVNGSNVTYFDSFGVEHIPKEIKKSIGNKNITTNIYRIQRYNAVMSGYFFIGFVYFMLKRKSLLGYTSSLFPNEYQKNNKKILKYFQ